jgi:hypothetical protein
MCLSKAATMASLIKTNSVASSCIKSCDLGLLLEPKFRRPTQSELQAPFLVGKYGVDITASASQSLGVPLSACHPSPSTPT